MNFSKETEIGEILVPYLQSNNEVFQEVSLGYGQACDIVFKDKLRKINCVEMKLHLNLEVICQCMHWYEKADFVWIAIPSQEKKKVYRLYQLFNTLKIGVILVYNDEIKRVEEYYRAKQLNNKPFDWNKYLFSRHANDVKAGSKLGKRSTPFSRTVSKIRHYKKNHPEATLEECLKNINHHYANLASAKNSIKNYLRHHIIHIKGFDS